MKYLFLPLLFFFTTALAAQTPQLALRPEASWEEERYWSEINNVDGRFQLLAPAGFEHRVDSIDTGIGLQALHTYYIKTPDPAKSENVIYALSYVDYPGGTIHHDSTELIRQLFASTEEEAVNAMHGALVYASDKDVSAYPARQWRIDYNDGKATARTLAAVAGNRYYEVKVFSLKAAGPNKAATRFLGSFRIFDADESEH